MLVDALGEAAGDAPGLAFALPRRAWRMRCPGAAITWVIRLSALLVRAAACAEVMVPALSWALILEATAASAAWTTAAAWPPAICERVSFSRSRART